MAFGQTLISSRNLFFTVPQNPHPHPNTKTSTLSPSLTPKNSSFVLNKRPRSFRTLKCSVDYRDQHYNLEASYPKPSQIPWSKDLCNPVHLIGNVGAPVEIKHLPSAKSSLGPDLRSKNPPPTPHANTAYQHVEKGQQVYVCGRLVSDTVESDDGKQQTYYKIVVQQINFVERNSSSLASYDGGFSGMSNRKFGNNGVNNMGSTVELWQAFFANPTEWWDNRKNMRSPKYPDFKHKDTGEALWVEGRNNPHWVKSQLAQILE